MSTHCQICGRDIKAKHGKIAHHGFQRPRGWYMQTASCFGARWEPYEVSREAIRHALRSNLAFRTHVQAMIRLYETLVDANGEPIEKLARPFQAAGRLHHRDRVALRNQWGTAYWVAATDDNRDARPGDEDFEPLRAFRIKEQQQQLRGLEMEFRFLADRWRKWKAPK